MNLIAASFNTGIVVAKNTQTYKIGLVTIAILEECESTLTRDQTCTLQAVPAE